MTTIPILGTVEVITKRLIPTPRRPEAAGKPPTYHPRTIGIVDPPLPTAELPLLAQLAAYQPARPAPVAAHARGRHRRPTTSFLPSLADAMAPAGIFAAGVVSGVAAFLIGAGW